MNKRKFIKVLSAAIASPAVAPLLSWAAEEKLKNWAGNIEYSTDDLYQAASVADAQGYIKSHGKLKALGTRHCFNTIADSSHSFLSFQKMDDVVSLDADARTVTVHAGMKYGQLAPYIDAKGFALHNLASLPHISVAGACSTATHGSGEKNGNLATAVAALEFVPGRGGGLGSARSDYQSHPRSAADVSGKAVRVRKFAFGADERAF
jgi:xylitol oxidase